MSLVGAYIANLELDILTKNSLPSSHKLLSVYVDKLNDLAYNKY
jgi:hypothetical protein